MLSALLRLPASGQLVAYMLRVPFRHAGLGYINDLPRQTVFYEILRLPHAGQSVAWMLRVSAHRTPRGCTLDHTRQTMLGAMLVLPATSDA